MSDEVPNVSRFRKTCGRWPKRASMQARKTFEKFLSTAQTTADSIEERGATMRAGAKDVSAKAIAYAEKNVQASLDYAENLLHAKRPARGAAAA